MKIKFPLKPKLTSKSLCAWSKDNQAAQAPITVRSVLPRPPPPRPTQHTHPREAGGQAGFSTRTRLVLRLSARSGATTCSNSRPRSGETHCSDCEHLAAEWIKENHPARERHWLHYQVVINRRGKIVISN